MTEKVKLPKEVCDALNIAKGYRVSDKTILLKIVNRCWVDPYFEPILKQDFNIIMRALVLGYEPELTAEERIKKLYDNPPIANTSLHEIYQYAIRDTLKIYNIHYDWLEDYDWLEGDAE